MSLSEELKAICKLTEESEQFLESDVMKLKFGTNVKEDHQVAHEALNSGLDFEFDGTVQEFKVPSRDVPDGILVDVIKPKVISRKPGIIIYFHGGGNTFGSRKTHGPICKLLASDLKCIIVNVEYRLAPEFKFPAMFEDGKSVTRWVLMNKPLIGAENDSKVGVCGSSAGGGIAATVAFEVPTIDFQILVYPLVDWRANGEDYADLGPCSIEMFNKMVDLSCNSPDDCNNVRASPLLQKNFARLPPTLVIIAEADPLKASNYAFKAKVKAANIHCESKLIKGTVHGFFSLPGCFKVANGQAREAIEKFFKKNGAY